MWHHVTVQTGAADRQQNQLISRVVRDMTPHEFAEMLESLSETDAQKASRLLRARLARRGEIETAAQKLRDKVVFGTARMVPFALAVIASEQLDERAKEVLGERYGNPSREEVADLADIMSSEFGLPRTRLWFTHLVAIGVVATPHIEAVAAGIDGLELRPDTPDTSVTLPVNETDQETREIRRRRRREQRDERARIREAAESSRANNRRFDRRRGTRHELPEVDETPSEPTDTVPREWRTHPRLARYPKADPRHELVGGIIIAWIRFTSEPDTGKQRPCVILAVEDRRMVVKPLYSHPRYGAGFWRAVEIMHWESAGLDHKSWAGDEIHTVRRFNDVIGRLHIDDWNRICLGESIPGQ